MASRTSTPPFCTGARPVTQRISEFVYGEGFDGIRCLPKYGHAIENWALFEPAELTSIENRQVQPDDPDLLEALRIFGLALQ